jgi:hypothetical protein
LTATIKTDDIGSIINLLNRANLIMWAYSLHFPRILWLYN